MNTRTPFATYCLCSCLVAVLAGPASGCAGPGADEPGTPATPDLEVVAEVTQGPGNITVTPDGQVVMTLHQFYEPADRVVALGDGGALTAFAAPAGIDSALGIQADRDGVVWLLDNGMRSGAQRRLVGWSSAQASAVADIDLTAASPQDAFLNDLVIDSDNGAAYIADPAGGQNAGLIVVDLASGQARRVLEGHESVIPEDIDLIIDGVPVLVTDGDGQQIRPRIGVNPIAADSDNTWLYFGPMHARSMYRVRTADLRDPDLPAETLAGRVERWSDKPICDGIAMDRDNNIYVSDVGNNAIGIIGADRTYRTLIADARLSWPDAFSFGPDGYVYTVANQLHRSAALSGGNPTASPPYLVLRFRPLADGVVGR